MTYLAEGGPDRVITADELRALVADALARIAAARGPAQRVLALPPDYSRAHSQAGPITEQLWRVLGPRLTDIMPAIGTHFPMTDTEITTMFGATPHSLFREHRWRSDIVTLGEVPGEFVARVSEGRLNYAWPAQINTLVQNGGHDLILSVGQVVPHEVIGMANHNKNVFVGTGGKDGINKSHFIGAVYGMERIMGRAASPVRAVLNYASEHFAAHLPIVYLLTVVGREADGSLAVKGLFVGDDTDCYTQAAALSLQVNFTLVEKPLPKVVVYLDPGEFKSTWIGNKAIYRSRMAIADGGELVVLAPGVREFGEDTTIDRLIRQFGYRPSATILDMVKTTELADHLGAAAHLIHGSSEGRFRVTYCPGRLSQEAIEAVGFAYGDLATTMQRYNPQRLQEGYNRVAGEDVFFIGNPAVGLWAHPSRFVD